MNGVFNTSSISVKLLPKDEDLQICLNDKDITARKAILQNQYWKTSAVESVLNKIARRDSRLATILKRSFHQVGFPVNTLELPVLLQKGLT